MFTKGIHLADPFDRRVEEMTNRTPPTMVVNSEPKIGPWTKNANLGIEVPFAPNADNRQTILKMPEWGFPEIWTISLGVSHFNIENLALFNGRNITAVIEFGVGGFTQTLEADWRVGTQISVVTNSINVIAEFANVDVGPEGDFKLSVQVARGTRPSYSSGPTRTLVVGPEATGSLPNGTIMESVTIGPGQDSGLIRLPPFANRLFVMPAVLNSGAIGDFFSDDIIIELSSGTGIGSLSVQVLRGSDLRLQDGIKIFGSAQFARIINTGPNFITISSWAELAA